MRDKAGIVEIDMEDIIESQNRKARSSSGRKRLAARKRKNKEIEESFDEKEDTRVSEGKARARKEAKIEKTNNKDNKRKQRTDIGKTHKKRNLKEVMLHDKKFGTSQAKTRLRSSLVKSKTKPYDPSVALTASQLNENTFRHEYLNILNNLRSVSSTMKDSMDSKDYVSSKDIYAMSTLYSQIRETIADLRSIADASEQTARLIEDILEPFHRSIGNSIVSILIEIRRLLQKNLKADLAQRIEADINALFGNEALKMQEYYQESCDKVKNIMELSK